MISDDEAVITEENALAIAAEAAGQFYRDTSGYRITARHEADAWYVDYTVADPDSVGGGPHFVIDAVTGEIVSRRFAQ